MMDRIYVNGIKIYLLMLMLLFSILVSRVFAGIDTEISNIFKTYLEDDKDVLACGVVDLESGDIITRWIKDVSMESKSNNFAFTLRDVVINVKKNLESLGYSFKLMGIKFNKGFLLLAPVNDFAFVGCLYSSEVNEAKERLTFIQKIVPDIKKKL